MKLSVATVVAAALAFACIGPFASAETSVGRAADVQALKKTEDQWNKDFASKNYDALVQHYTNDASLVGGGGPAVIGADNIRGAYKQMLSDPNFALQFQARRIEVAKSGDIAYTEGSYTMTMTDPSTKKPMNDKGSYLTAYKKQPDGSWKTVADYAASEMPPGGSSSNGK